MGVCSPAGRKHAAEGSPEGLLRVHTRKFITRSAPELDLHDETELGGLPEREIVSSEVGARPRAEALAKAWERLGNPLEWDEARKVLLILCLLVPMSFAGLLRAIYLTRHPELEPYVSRAALTSMVEIGAVYLLFAVFLVLVGVWLIRTGRPTRIYAYAANQSWWLLIAWFAYMNGLATSPLWVVYVLLGTMCLLLFDLPVALAGVATGLCATMATAVAERIGWIPYAPYFAEWPEVDGRLADEWVLSSMIWPFGASIVVFAAFAAILRRARSQSEQLAEMTRVLREMFVRYMSTEVTRALLEDPGALELGGQRRSVTILMTDLRGFTALSERLRPEDAIALLNDYFEVMIDVCLRHDGTINEIVGDALLVTFGAPQEMEDHAAAGVACASDSRRRPSLRPRHGPQTPASAAIRSSSGSSERWTYPCAWRSAPRS